MRHISCARFPTRTGIIGHLYNKHAFIELGARRENRPGRLGRLGLLTACWCHGASKQPDIQRIDFTPARHDDMWESALFKGEH